jgi:hypothetical protein
MSRKSRSLNLLEPQEPHQACRGKNNNTKKRKMMMEEEDPEKGGKKDEIRRIKVTRKKRNK